METKEDAAIVVDKQAALFAALSRAQKKFKAVLKNKVVDFTHNGKRTNFEYADLSGYMASTIEALESEGLCVLQPIQTDITGAVTSVLITTILGHKFGGSITSTFPLRIKDGMREQDIGAMITYGRKYAYQSMLCLIGEEGEEEILSQQDAPKPQAKAAPKSPSPAQLPAPDAVKQGSPDLPLSEQQLKMLFACAKENDVAEDSLKMICAGYGYASRKDIKRKDFEQIISDIQRLGGM